MVASLGFFQNSDFNKILDQLLAPLHSATIDADPIAAARAISGLNQDIVRRRSLNDGNDDLYSAYLNRELYRRLLDSREVLQGLKFAKPVEFTLRTDVLSPKGMRIRDSLNQLLAAEEVVGFACADLAHAQMPECGAISEHAQELKTLHKVADRLAVTKQEQSYQELIAGLEIATGAIGKLVSGFGDGAAERSGAIIQGLNHLANHPIDTASALYHAIRTLKTVHGIDLVWDRIQSFAKEKLDEIMTGDPEKIGFYQTHQGPRLWWIDPPTDAEIQALGVTLAKRVIRFLKKKGYFEDDLAAALPDEEMSQEEIVEQVAAVSALNPATEVPKKKRRMGWAELLARMFAIDMKSCPRCSGELKISAAIIQADAIKKILTHLNIPHKPPDIAPARLHPHLSLT